MSWSRRVKIPSTPHDRQPLGSGSFVRFEACTRPLRNERTAHSCRSYHLPIRTIAEGSPRLELGANDYLTRPIETERALGPVRHNIRQKLLRLIACASRCINRYRWLFIFVTGLTTRSLGAPPAGDDRPPRESTRSLTMMVFIDIDHFKARERHLWSRWSAIACSSASALSCKKRFGADLICAWAGE